MKNLNLVMPPCCLSSSAWNAFKLVATTKLYGQMSEAGQTWGPGCRGVRLGGHARTTGPKRPELTKKRLAMPAKPKPAI
jgi:hypothetical protein